MYTKLDVNASYSQLYTLLRQNNFRNQYKQNHIPNNIQLNSNSDEIILLEEALCNVLVKLLVPEDPAVPQLLCCLC